MRIGQRGANGQPGGSATSDGGVALDRRQRLPLADVDARDRAEQAQRVRHPRAVEHVVDRADLDELAGVHHRDPIGDAGDRRRDRA